jgi:hypothetical protein
MIGMMRVGAMLGLLALAACVAPPSPSAARIAEVTPLQTKYDDVVAMFGLPSSEVALTGGGRMVLYNQAEFDRNAFQLVPFLNLTENNYDLITYDYFVFDRDGVLQSFSIPHFAARAGVANPGGA